MNVWVYVCMYMHVYICMYVCIMPLSCLLSKDPEEIRSLEVELQMVEVFCKSNKCS